MAHETNNTTGCSQMKAKVYIIMQIYAAIIMYMQCDMHRHRYKMPTYFGEPVIETETSIVSQFSAA